MNETFEIRAHQDDWNMADDVKNQRRAAKGKFTRKLNELKKAIDEDCGVEIVKRNYDELVETWKTVELKHDVYTTFLTDEEVEAGDTWILELQDLFSDAMKRQNQYEKKKTFTDNEAKEQEEKKQAVLREEEKFQRMLDQAYVRRSSAKAVFGQAINIVKYSSLTALKVAKKELDEAFADCKKANNEYLSLLPRERATLEITWIVAIQNMYSQAAEEVETKLTEELSIQETAKMNLRLEKIKMPRFEGELREYPRFKADFQKQVMTSLSPATAPYTLRSCLGKEPLGVVKSVDDDIHQIWKRLDEKYGDPSKIADAIIDTIRKVRPIRDGESKRLIEFIDILEDGFRDLKRLDLEVEMTTTSSVSIIEKKLPASVRKEWAKMVTDDNSKVERVNKFPSLLQFLLSQKRAIEYDAAELRKSNTSYKSAAHHVVAKEQDTRQPGERQQRYYDGKISQKCLLHDNADHWTNECRIYLSKPYSEKKDLIKTKKACWSCLKPGQLFRDCKRKKNCGESGCTRRHHKTLHNPEESQNSTEEPVSNQHSKTQDEETPKGKRATSCDSLAEETCLLLFQKILTPKGDVNVMWDSGASLRFITNAKAEEQRLPSKNAQLTIIKVGGKTETIDSKRYKLHLIDKQRCVVEIDAFGIDRITSDIHSIDVEGAVHLFKDIKRDDIARPEGSVDVLIGYEYAAFHPEPEQKVEHLMLLKNRFGRCLGGRHPLLKEVKETRSQHVLGGVHHVSQVKPKVDLEDFYKIENLGIECTPRCGGCKCGKCPPGSKDYTLKEERGLKLIEQNLKFNNEENTWTAVYPWIRNPAELPDNRKAAMGLLMSTEKRLVKNPEHAKVYQEQIDDMIDRNVARKLTAEEMRHYKGPVHYISHHEVLRPDSKSTPVRIVFNSSANYMGHVLNEYWAKGPDLLNNLLGVLVRFRENETAITGDITKMYHTVKIGIKDQNTHRFLWRNMEKDREPDTYVIQRVSFGDKPAGTIATVALRKKTITSNTYMDDIIDSVKSKEEAKSLTTDIETLLRKGGFQVKYWTFSRESNQGDDKPLLQDERNSSSEKVLGVAWSPVKDQFYFKVRLNFSPKKKKLRTEPELNFEQIPERVPEPLTKRMILSQVNGIYDPLGLAGPFTVKAKMLMRRLWLNDPKLDWDDPIPDMFQSEWLQIFKHFFGMEKISFNRCIKPSNAVGDPSLVIFSDGSQEAYGACAYVRWEMPENTFESNLIMSKNRLTPVKKMSIDRIELCGAVLNKRLKVFIEKESRYNFVKFYHLVDSQIVQAMVQKESYGFNTFAGTRIGEIQEKTNPSDWYWIDGELNIADWLTRGKKPDELDVESAWQKGPEFLELPVSEWPITQKPTSIILPETVQPVMMAQNIQSDTLEVRINIERFSSYIRLLRVTARVLAMYQKDASPKSKPSFKNATKPLSSEEIEKAELFWIRNAQVQLKQNMNNKSSKRLCPKINKDHGMITVGGRVDNLMQMSYNQNEVILLPYDHRFSRLYLTYVHNQGHYGVATTVAKVRARFWIISAHKMAKSIKFHCVTCKKLEKKTEEQVMSKLPVERLKPAPAWSSIGIDLFGLFSIRDEVKKRSTGKAYGVIFNCLGSRAVHVDDSPDYSAQKFLMVLRRFVALRGYPKQIISDNGTQLVAANEELKSVTQSWDWDKLAEFGATEGMQWKFTPADAPWYNGISEALIKSVKKALTVAIGNNIMTFSELQTVCYEAANLVNERPIGRLPTQPDDGKYLCPNDLLLGRSTSRIPSGPFKETANPRYRFEFVQSIVNAFWKKWTQNFFPSLLVRQKWHTARRDVKVGDIVMIQDSNLVRGNWKLGKVSKAESDQDGKVRRVQVQYKVPKQGEPRKTYQGRNYTTVERAVQKLVVLIPVEEIE